MFYGGGGVCWRDGVKYLRDASRGHVRYTLCVCPKHHSCSSNLIDRQDDPSSGGAGCLAMLSFEAFWAVAPTLGRVRHAPFQHIVLHNEPKGAA